MLKEYHKGEIRDVYGKFTGIKFEVNWNPEDSNSNECKIIKITKGTEEWFVDKKEFLNFLWLIGSSDEHTKMIPQTISRTKWYETVLSVKARKDIRKGDQITFPIKLSLPAVEEEVIGEIKKQQSSNILIPK